MLLTFIREGDTMKKIMAAALALGLISTSSMAAIWIKGTVVKIEVSTTATTLTLSKTSDASLIKKDVDGGLSADNAKLLMATIMTAYAAGDTVIVKGTGTTIEGAEISK